MLLHQSPYGGFFIATRFAFFFSIFPGGLTLGMFFDRKIAKDVMERIRKKTEVVKFQNKKNKINREDILRIVLIIFFTIISLPWIMALLGLNITLFLNPIHVGENHGYYGYLLVLFALLNTKIIKYNQDSISRDGIIFGFTLAACWGAIWMLDDFLIEQFGYHVGIYSPGDYYYMLMGIQLDPIKLFINILIPIGSSALIFLVFWEKIYHKRISRLEHF
ncbi:MAG: hypothetical protein ACTSX4_06390 [Candidatus Helarchaeota archaeon]